MTWPKTDIGHRNYCVSGTSFGFQSCWPSAPKQLNPVSHRAVTGEPKALKDKAITVLDWRGSAMAGPFPLLGK